MKIKWLNTTFITRRINAQLGILYSIRSKYGEQFSKLDSIIGRSDVRGQQLTSVQTTINAISDKISTLITAADKKTAPVTNSIVGNYTSKPITNPNSTTTSSTTNKTTNLFLEK